MTPIVSICVSVKNRSRLFVDGRTLTLLPHCVRSIAEAAEELAEPVELVVADFRSDDWPLAEWLAPAARSLQVQLLAVDEPFSRGRGLNVASRSARSDRFLLLDADMLLGAVVLRRGLECIAEGQVWFPVCRCLDAAGRVTGWQDWGYGNVGLMRQDLERAGPVPEYDSWGGEDYVLRDRLAQRCRIIRERAGGLFHQWHPESARHVHYGKPEFADYRAHQAREEASSRGGVVASFDCVHPSWRGVLHCYADGTMARPGVDEGRYEFDEGRRIVLAWERWPPEELRWDAARNVYRHPQKPFVMKLQSAARREIANA
ncbi:MAG: glycosyltransferase family 2 protein [Planctomycetales bacterium]|nr:glycosyltransferase family 2 protein [Planctomycetales bacterium]